MNKHTAVYQSVSMYGDFLIDPKDISLTNAVDDTTDLQVSIAEHDQVTPITVVQTPEGDKAFMVTTGNRRTVACKKLDRKVRAILDRNKDPDVAMLAYYAGNVQRKKNPLHEAIDLQQAELLTGNPKKAQRLMGLTVTRAALLRRLLLAPVTVQSAVRKGEISLTAFKKIATAPVETQEEIVEAAAESEDGMSARQVDRKRTKIEAEQKGDPAIEDLEHHQTVAGELRRLAITVRSAAPYGGVAKAPMLNSMNQVVELLQEAIELTE